MTNPDYSALSELKRLAEAATPGPWTYEGEGYNDHGGRTHVITSPCEEVLTESGGISSENAEYIAAANPAAIIATANEITRLHAAWQASNDDNLLKAHAITRLDAALAERQAEVGRLMLENAALWANKQGGDK